MRHARDLSRFTIPSGNVIILSRPVEGYTPVFCTNKWTWDLMAVHVVRLGTRHSSYTHTPTRCPTVPFLECGRSSDRERGAIVAEDGTDSQESLDPISAKGELRVEELHI